MNAIFSRRVVVVGSSSQLTKLVKTQLSQSRHFLSHLLPYGIFSSSSSSSSTRFLPFLLSRTLGNTNLKQKFRNVLESRVGFFSSHEFPTHGFESKGFTGFQKQKRGWKSWINGANGVVFGLIIANAAVFTMWEVSGKDGQKWMVKNFMLSRYSFVTGRIHTLITSGFTHIETKHIVWNMIGLCYFGTRIARTLGPRYLLKLYFAGALGSSVFFLSNLALWAISLKGQGVIPKDLLKDPIVQLGADGSVFAITLLDMLLYPKVTTYFGLMLRVPVMADIFSLGFNMLKMVEGKKNNISLSSSQLGGVAVAVMAWARILVLLIDYFTFSIKHWTSIDLIISYVKRYNEITITIFFVWAGHFGNFGAEYLKVIVLTFIPSLITKILFSFDVNHKDYTEQPMNY